MAPKKTYPIYYITSLPILVPLSKDKKPMCPSNFYPPKEMVKRVQIVLEPKTKTEGRGRESNRDRCRLTEILLSREISLGHEIC